MLRAMPVLTAPLLQLSLAYLPVLHVAIAAAAVFTAHHLPCRHGARCVHTLVLDSAAASMPTGTGLPC